ncbi:hypothetical protein BH18THE1_BH18THE1_16020 [soil metagenome]
MCLIFLQTFDRFGLQYQLFSYIIQGYCRIIRRETEEEIFKNGGQHATKDHGMKEKDLTPSFKEKVRGLIKDQ